MPDDAASRRPAGPDPSWLPTAESELSRITADLCSGVATVADQARLDHLLDDPENRRGYVALMRLHGELMWRWRKKSQGWSSALHNLPRQRNAGFVTVRERMLAWGKTAAKPLMRPEAISMLVAAFILCSLLIVGSFVPLPSISGDSGFGGRSGRGSIVAEITGLARVQWADPRRSPPPLWVAAGSMVELESGLVELTHACGARVIVEGPAAVQVQSGTSTKLIRGTLSISYDRKAGGAPDRGSTSAPAFIVQTPHAAVVDLGTEFAVGVEGTGAAQVHVFAGLVEIEPAVRDSDRGPTRLAAGDGAEIDAAGRIARGGADLARRITRRLPGAEPPPEWSEAEAVTLLADDFEGEDPHAAWLLKKDGWKVEAGRLRPRAKGVAVLPFEPEAGMVYRLSAEIDLPPGSPGWAAIGFCDRTGDAPFFSHSFAWMGQRGSVIPVWGGNFAYGGPGLTHRIGDVDSRFGRHIRTVQLDTRGTRWKAKFFVDGEQVAWFIFGPEHPPIQALLLQADNAPAASFDNLRLSVYRPHSRPAGRRRRARRLRGRRFASGRRGLRRRGSPWEGAESAGGSGFRQCSWRLGPLTG